MHILGIKALFDYFCVCVHNAYPRDLDSHMVSRLCVGNVYYETLDSGYALPLAARCRYVHFVFLSRLNWATLIAFAMTTSSLMAITTSSRISHKAFSSFYICDDNAHLGLSVPHFMLILLQALARAYVTLIIDDFGFYHSIMMPHQVEFLNAFRVCGVELSLPAPSHFGHRFLESPSPVAPEPWHTEQVTIQSSARS
jgi:hypothetical protein